MLFINVTGKNWLMQMVHTYMQDETRIASAAIYRNWCREWKALALHYPPPYLHADHCECLRPSSRCPESITCVTPATRGPAVNPRLTLGTHHRHHHTILLFDNILNWELFSEKLSCDQATTYNFCTIQIYMWWEKIAFIFFIFHFTLIWPYERWPNLIFLSAYSSFIAYLVCVLKGMGRHCDGQYNSPLSGWFHR